MFDSVALNHPRLSIYLVPSNPHVETLSPDISIAENDLKQGDCEGNRA